MNKKIIKGNEFIAKQIKSRRNELGLTIEEAASRAEIGTKTWCRYEAGESIRRDKVKGVCKALKWNKIPEEDGEVEEFSILDYKKGEMWSEFLEEKFGIQAAFSFAMGCEMLYDHIIEDMEELSSLPVNSHLGQLDISLLKDLLPEQFLMHYDYEFLYQMKCMLLKFMSQAKSNSQMIAHSVMEEIILYLCSKEAIVLLELSDEFKNMDYDSLSEGVFDILGDKDIILCLYSNIYLEPDHAYHFSHWTENQFYNN